MSAAKLVGRTTDFKGKTLWEIVGSLKNFGVGRVVVRNMFQRYPEPCFMRILKVEAAPNAVSLIWYILSQITNVHLCRPVPMNPDVFVSPLRRRSGADNTQNPWKSLVHPTRRTTNLSRSTRRWNSAKYNRPVWRRSCPPRLKCPHYSVPLWRRRLA